MTQDTRHVSALTQDTDETIEDRIRRSLADFGSADNLSRSAKELFETLGFGVVNEVTERKVSFESLYKRVQNKEATKRLKDLLDHVEACYYVGSLVLTGGEEFLVTQSEASTQDETDAQGDTDSGGTQAAGAGGRAQDDSAGESGTSAGDGVTAEEERDVHFFAAQLKEGVHFSRGQTAQLVRGFNRLMGSCPVVVAIRSTYAVDKPPATAGNGGLQVGSVGGLPLTRAGETPFADAKAGGAGEPSAKGYEGNSPQRTYMTLGLCERSSYAQEWRVGSRLGKVRLMADVRCDKVHRGHMDILKSVAHEVSPLATAADVWQGLLRVFSVGLLTKRFYGELESWYVAAA